MLFVNKKSDELIILFNCPKGLRAVSQTAKTKNKLFLILQILEAV